MALTAARNVAGARVGAKVHRAPRVAPVSGARAARGMSVYAFKVTLKTPSGEQVVECGADEYILVRPQLPSQPITFDHIGSAMSSHVLWQYAST
jgi:hypothetical protein